MEQRKNNHRPETDNKYNINKIQIWDKEKTIFFFFSFSMREEIKEKIREKKMLELQK